MALSELLGRVTTIAYNLHTTQTLSHTPPTSIFNSHTKDVPTPTNPYTAHNLARFDGLE